MNGISATCWKCGALQTEILLPLSRTEICTACACDLHVCRMCQFFDKSVSNACREPVADFVSDKTRANFCGYLELKRDAGTHVQASGQSEAEAALGALFDLDTAADKPQETTQALDDLFGLDDKNT